MAITKSFAGRSIKKPGAYSRSRVDNSGGAPLRANNTLFLVGESSKGAPGTVEGIVEFSAERLDSLVEKYGQGPLVDCALASTRPSRQDGIGGASRIMIYKTNASTQASAFLKKAPDNIYQVKDIAWGVDGNLLSVIVAAGSSADQKLISVTKLGDTTESLGENPNQSVMTIDYTGDATTAAMTISGATRAALTLATTLAGDQTDGSVNLSITLANYTIKQLVDYINAQVGYAATLSTVSLSSKKANELDPRSSTSILSPVTLKRLQYEILEVLNNSGRIEATIQNPPIVGLIDNGTTPLVGGAKGASTNSNFSTGFSKSLAKDYNVLLPAVSRDAAEDIADANQGFTDAASTYTIASILAAAESHLRLRGDVKNRKEAMGMGGTRKSTKAAALAAVSAVGSELMQVAIQDCLVIDETGSLSYKHPHVFASLCAGIRLGTPVGEPLTHKFLNTNQIGHFINPLTGLETGDFNPGTDFDEAIDSGVLFAEEAQGGFRIVVDNTTYGIDDSFVFNRGSVVVASQFVAKTIRETAELVFVGRKVSNGLAQSIKSVIRNKLRELNAPDVNIITASDDAPEGFREDTFVVTVTGNTANVQVEVKPVQGLDFVFISFTLGDIRQSA